jgi:hypothetical protein
VIPACSRGEDELRAARVGLGISEQLEQPRGRFRVQAGIDLIEQHDFTGPEHRDERADHVKR